MSSCEFSLLITVSISHHTAAGAFGYWPFISSILFLCRARIFSGFPGWILANFWNTLLYEPTKMSDMCVPNGVLHTHVWIHFKFHVEEITLTRVFQALTKCKSVQKPHTNLPDSPVALTSTSKYFQMLPAPPGAWQRPLRLYRSILRCFWKYMH